jgi:ABC-type polysaccharide/polyol phosphate transport system ATPase subunit
VSDPVVVHLEGLGKRFKLYAGARHRLLDWLQVPPRPRYREFWALRDVSLEVRKGECLGIIGPNGAGKSTLLKLLTGALHPTVGHMQIQGRVLSLLELGTGFTPELTGRQNIAQSARLVGFPRGYAEARAEEIASFAELGDYFDRPIKFYSSGMLVRLAFSLFSTMDPEVFLVDEALAVGDMRFASKAFGRIRRMLDRGTTLLFVSHDLQLVNQLCTRVLWIQSGAMQMLGVASEVTRAYQQFVVHGAAPAPSAAPGAHAQPDRLALGSGWYPLEAFDGEVFRWAAPEAEIVIPEPRPIARELLLDLDVLSAGDEEPSLEITNEAGQRLTEVTLASRSTIRLPIAAADAAGQRLYVRATTAPPIMPTDDRQLSFRLFRWGWAHAPALRPIETAETWVESSRELDLRVELQHMRAALARCTPAAGAPVRIVRVATCTRAGRESVHFGSYESLSVEIEVVAERDALDLVAGIQVRDAFDRMLWTTRTDWQAQRRLDLHGGSRGVFRFQAERLLLGRGLYQLSVAIHAYPRENNVFHWVDGAWRFEVVEASDAEFKGSVDLGWRFDALSVARPLAAHVAEHSAAEEVTLSRRRCAGALGQDEHVAGQRLRARLVDCECRANVAFADPRGEDKPYAALFVVVDPRDLHRSEVEVGVHRPHGRQARLTRDPVTQAENEATCLPRVALD